MLHCVGGPQHFLVLQQAVMKYQITIWFTVAMMLLSCQHTSAQDLNPSFRKQQNKTNQSTTAETTDQKTTETNGQSHVSPDTPDHAAPAEVAVNKSPNYVIPDVPHGWNEFNNRWFSTTLGFAPIVDYSGFTQDNDSITQVGKQDSRWDIRSGRFSFRGQIHTRRPITYFLSLEYKGLDRPPEAPSFGITDFWFSIPIHKKVGTLTFGKIKETFVYEMVGDAANLPFLERTLNPFFVSRGIGVKLSNSVLNDRMTYAVGWFNDWFTQGQSFSESANDVTARVTALPLYSKDGANYLHLATSYRYAGGENGVVRLKGRPESNIASNFVDTGDIPASHQNEIGLEFLATRGTFSVLGDYAESYVYSSTRGVPHFYGASVTATWTITGEHRPYDRKVGYARRIIPEGRWGAWEVVARYSHIDLNDRSVTGGILHKGLVGVNWWASPQWRISFGYGLADLDRKGVSSLTNIFQTRFQWIF
jgi:hypothetical protein